MQVFIIIAVIFVLLFVLWIFLIAPQTKFKNEVYNYYSILFAHRGLFNNEKKIPENSVNAFMEVEKKGFSVEFDVRLTADDKVVVVHDENLKRLCNKDINVSECNYSELSELRLFDTDEKIPLLRDVLKIFSGKFPVIIELKSENDNYILLCKKTFEILDDYKGKFFIQSFDPRVLKWVRENRPNVLRGQLAGVDYKVNGKFNLKKMLFGFIINNLLTNFLTRPDYIAYRFKNRHNISLMLCRRLYRVPVAYWTIKNKNDFFIVNDEVALTIFDGFDPHNM